MSNINNNLRHQIGVAAYYLSQKNYTYDTLCWMLAERRLIAQQDPMYAHKERIREKAAEIYFYSTPYDILVWLIAELDIKLKIKKARKPQDRII
ncbi:MAG: hypothetical protein ACFFG0_16160 [Candidatus Thorarchaeota archaeon]